MENQQDGNERAVRIIEAGQSSSSTFAAAFHRSNQSLQLQNQLATAMQQYVDTYQKGLKRVIAEEEKMEHLTAAKQSSCMPIQLRHAVKVPHLSVRHTATSAELTDRFTAMSLQFQEQLLETALQHTQQSVAALTTDLQAVKTTAVAAITADFNAAVAHSAHKDDPAVQSLLTNALALLDIDLSNVQNKLRHNAAMRKQRQQDAEAKKLEQQQQRQQRQQQAGTSPAAAAAAAGAAAAAAIAAAVAGEPADAAMGDADGEVLPLNQEQHMQQQAAAAAANQPVTLNQVAALVQQGITAALSAVAVSTPPQQPQQRPRPRPQPRPQPRPAAVPQRRHSPARGQQLPRAPRNRSRSASRGRAGNHGPAAPARRRSADRRPVPAPQQPAPHQQQQANPNQQQHRPNGGGGPAGHRNARGNFRRTGNAGNNRPLGRPHSR